MMKKILIGTSVLTVVMLAGCQAPRGLQHEVSAPSPVVDKQQNVQVQNFAKTLAEMPMSSVAVVNDSPVGAVQVSKDREYTNALGEQCYRYTLTSDATRKQVAVCRVSGEHWRYVELVH